MVGFAIIFLTLLSIIIYLTGRGILAILLHLIVIKQPIFWLIYLLVQLIFISLLFIPSRILHIINSYWMAFVLYFTMLCLIVGVVKLFPLSDIFIKFLDFGTLIITVFILVIGSFIAENIKLTTYQAEINKPIPELNIIMFSDIHLGNKIGYQKIQEIVEKTNALKPDLVLIPGDIFDGSITNVLDLDKITSDLAKIKTKYGVFATLGNHDYLKDDIKVRQFFKDSNIILLQDEVNIFKDFIIIGRDDLSPIDRRGASRKPLTDLLKNLDQALPIILLDHQPFGIDDAINNNIDLFVAGHAHNGQVFPGSIITDHLYKVGYGYQVFNQTHVIVTSGVGYWGPPIRVGSISEIVNIKIKAKK